MAEVERMKVAALTPHPRLGTTELLPALTDAEYEALEASIAGVGMLQPIVVDADGVVIDGHHRLRAAQALGLTEVTVFRARGPNAKLEVLGVTLNAARRQMTSEQKRAAIGTLLREDAARSDRWIAHVLGCSHTTVAAVRGPLEEAGEVARSSSRTDQRGAERPAHKPVSERVRDGRKKAKDPSRLDRLRETREAEALARELPAETVIDEPSGVQGERREGIERPEPHVSGGRAASPGRAGSDDEGEPDAPSVSPDFASALSVGAMLVTTDTSSVKTIATQISPASYEGYRLLYRYLGALLLEIERRV